MIVLFLGIFLLFLFSVPTFLPNYEGKIREPSFAEFSYTENGELKELARWTCFTLLEKKKHYGCFGNTEGEGWRWLGTPLGGIIQGSFSQVALLPRNPQFSCEDPESFARYLFFTHARNYENYEFYIRISSEPCSEKDFLIRSST